MQPTITFKIKTGKKTRLITTYKNNEDGSKLKLEHEKITSTLKNDIFDHDVTFAYLPKQNTKKLVEKHLSNTYFYQFDLKNFFQSIDLNILKQISAEYCDINLEQIISECAFTPTTGLGIGLLPSPYLSNLYLIIFDRECKNFAQKNHLIYTRYADDITFSSNSAVNLNELIYFLNQQLKPLKLSLNPQKTQQKHLVQSGDSVKILGINIVLGSQNNYLTISRKFKRQSIQEQNQLRKHGMKNYIAYNQSTMI